MTRAPPIIRRATGADDVAIGELLVGSFSEQYARKMPHLTMSQERRAELKGVREKRAVASVWVADEGGTVVGTVSLWPPGADGSEAWLAGAFDLRHLAVAASHRGQGLSGRLLDVAEGHAREAGSPAVCLHVRRGVHGVIRLYRARGYVRAEQGDLDALPEVYLEAFWLRLGPEQRVERARHVE